MTAAAWPAEGESLSSVFRDPLPPCGEGWGGALKSRTSGPRAFPSVLLRESSAADKASEHSPSLAKGGQGAVDGALPTTRPAPKETTGAARPDCCSRQDDPSYPPLSMGDVLSLSASRRNEPITNAKIGRLRTSFHQSTPTLPHNGGGRENQGRREAKLATAH